MNPGHSIPAARLAAHSVSGALALLEDGVARLGGAALALTDLNNPLAVALREEAADRAVDLLAARAWHAQPGSLPGAHPTAAHRCVAYTVAADAALATAPNGDERDRVAEHRKVGDALLLLTLPEHFDGSTAQARALLGPPPQGRLAAAWQMVDETLAGLATTRHEWVGADPSTVAAAGWVLVDRIGRLLAAAALVAHAAERQRSAPFGSPAAKTAELLVNAARRYAWNHLRRPAPEAATPAHVERSDDLVRALAPHPTREPRH